MRHQTSVAVLLVVLVSGVAAGQAMVDHSFDFESDTLGLVPQGWFVPPMLAESMTVEVTADRPAGGARCVRISKKAGQQVANLMQSLPAQPFAGTRVRLRASVRIEPPGGAARAQLWMRVDRPGGAMGLFDNMGDRPIISGDWAEYEITGDVEEDAQAISFGVLVFGAATAWIDDVRLEVAGAAGAGLQPAAPLSRRGRANVESFARLLGYVRHFHPSDEAETADWDRLAIEGVHVVEDATDARELAERLRLLFERVAPTVQITAAALDPPMVDPVNEPDAAEGFTFWEHLGYGRSAVRQQMAIYNSRRHRYGMQDAVPGEIEIRPGSAVERDLGGGVRCRVPLCVYYGADGTLPAAIAVDEPAWSPPEGWHPSGSDRGTRLAAIVLGWNVMQHFYPYFDVIDTSWEQTLSVLLDRAATDVDAAAFAETVAVLVARLQDGHGFASPPSFGGSHRLPFDVAWIDDAPVVTAVYDNGAQPAPGDVIVEIDGADARRHWGAIEDLISGATTQWKRHRARAVFVLCDSADPREASFRRPDGTVYGMRVQPMAMSPDLREPRPDKITEVEPGIWYVDIGRINDADFNAAVDDLAEAKGVVFDLRGYPRNLSTVVIAHLIDEPITCAQWHVPRVHRPDREGMQFRFSNWQVAPRKPKLGGKVAFIIDGRAISYAETYMGMIEHYGLAEIVGEATAGTNGNVNSVRLPGGYTFSFTGMKVLKHDGSRHHGVGVLPTIPVQRTIAGVAAGKDEMLERAVAVVR